MKKAVLLVVVLLVGCAQPPSRLPSTSHEIRVAIETPQPSEADRAAARPLPIVPPLAAITPHHAVAATARSGELSNDLEQTPAAEPDAPPATLWARLIAGF